MLRHVQTDQGRVLLNAQEYRTFRHNQAMAVRKQETAPPAVQASEPPAPQTLYGAQSRPVAVRRMMVQVELPHASPGGVRWVSSRKAALASAVLRGQLDMEDACDRYGITAEELTGWMCDFRRGGQPALRSTKISQKRRTSALLGESSTVCQEL